MNEYRKQKSQWTEYYNKNALTWHGMKIKRYCLEKKILKNLKSVITHAVLEPTSKKKLFMKMIV